MRLNFIRNPFPGKCPALRICHLSVLVGICLAYVGEVVAKESTCFGTTKNGRLENGVQLPGKGVNFVSYGTVPEIVGCTYVHSTVKNMVIILNKISQFPIKNPGLGMMNIIM